MDNAINYRDLNSEIRNMPLPDMKEATDAFISQIDRNHAPRGKHAGKETYSASTYAWLQSRSERFDYVNEEEIRKSKYSRIKTEGSYSGRVGFEGKTKTALLKKVLAVALVVAAGTGTVAYSAAQADSFTKATQVVDVVDLPNESYNDYDLQLRANGDAMFVNQNGDTVKEYNGVNANALAQNYVQADEMNAGHTR